MGEISILDTVLLRLIHALCQIYTDMNGKLSRCLMISTCTFLLRILGAYEYGPKLAAPLGPEGAVLNLTR